MHEIVFDDALRSQVNGADTVYKVRDSKGALIGRYLPNDIFEMIFHEWCDAVFPRGEHGAAMQEYRKNGGLTTAEAIAYIRRMAGEQP